MSIYPGRMQYIYFGINNMEWSVIQLLGHHKCIDAFYILYYV